MSDDHFSADYVRGIAKEWERLRIGVETGAIGRSAEKLPMQEERAAELARFIEFHEDNIIAILKDYAPATLAADAVLSEIYECCGDSMLCERCQRLALTGVSR